MAQQVLQQMELQVALQMEQQALQKMESHVANYALFVWCFVVSFVRAISARISPAFALVVHGIADVVFPWLFGIAVAKVPKAVVVVLGFVGFGR